MHAIIQLSRTEIHFFPADALERCVPIGVTVLELPEEGVIVLGAVQRPKVSAGQVTLLRLGTVPALEGWRGKEKVAAAAAAGEM